MPPDFTALPALKSKERQALVDKLAKAFGNDFDRNAAVDPDAVYEMLSQYSYHDRMTLIRETVRQQNPKQYQAIEDSGVVDNEYKNYRILLCNKMTFDSEEKPRTAGFNRYLCLVADAPRSDITDRNLTDEIFNALTQFSPSTKEGKPNPEFWEGNGEGNQYKVFWDKFFEPKGVRDPKAAYQRLANVGIRVGAPPPRKPPLGSKAAETYAALPAADSKERTALVEKLAAQISKEPHGFKDQEEVFKLLAPYSYSNRLAVYKEALKKAGINDYEGSSELRLRMSLVSRFARVNKDGKGSSVDDEMSFAGVVRYFALVADAPRNTEQNAMLRAEYKYIWTDFKRTSFVDRDEPGVKPLYQKFFGPPDDATKEEKEEYEKEIVGGDPYTNLTYMGIQFRQPPSKQRVVPLGKLAKRDADSMSRVPRLFSLDTMPFQRFLSLPSTRELLIDTATELNRPESSTIRLRPYNPVTSV